MTPQRVDYVMGILMDHVSTPMGPLNAESPEEGAEACFRWLMDNPNLWVCADRFDWLSSENLEMAALLESMLDLSGFKFVKNGQRFKIVDPTKYALLNENKWAQPFVFSWPDRPIKDSARPGDNQTLRNRVTELPELFDVPHVWSGYRFYVCSKPPKPIEEIRFEESIKFRI